ncbi:response regulator transcription factor [Cohnella cellulosilytica]|uniref:Helix-turn-helix domain-containing protein n=1 Tax=Cohnella cellulosilytica TaxID=986710 RepID=A0ABW2FEJ4_9BACL
MNILIADDEYLARETLKSMLLDLPVTSEDIGEAANGAELLEQAERLQPDIAFVDIRMPKLDGLEGIRQARLRSPATQWVILTGYAEFEYARQALQLGASHYLLKPPEPDSVAEVLRELAPKINAERRMRQAAFEQALAPLLQVPSSNWPTDLETKAFMEAGLSPNRFVARWICVDDVRSREQLMALLVRAQSRLREEALAVSRDGWATALPPEGNGFWVAATWRSEPEADRRCGEGGKRETEFVEHAARVMRELAGRDGGAAVTSFDASGSGTEEPKHWLRRAGSIRWQAGRRALQGFGSDWSTLSSGPWPADDGRLRAVDYAEKLSAAFAGSMYEHALKQSLSFEYEMASGEASAGAGFFANFARYFNTRTGIALPATGPLGEWARRLRDEAKLRLEAQKPEAESGETAVRRAIRYIESHYMDDIGIAQAADRLNLTPNYLSHLFHRDTGMTFKAYLTHIRMLKAKELLGESGKKIKDVAEAVGYFSARHFSKTYLKYYGHFPSEEKKR